jgi:hypothetical protein
VRRKRLARVGKSLGVIVDRELLDALGFDASTPLELRVVRNCLTVTRSQLATLGSDGTGRWETDTSSGGVVRIKKAR